MAEEIAAPQPVGYLEVVVGPMYAEKTTYLFRLANLKRRAIRVLYVGPTSDTRSTEAFSTHNDLFSFEQLKAMFSTDTKVDMIKVSTLSELKDEYVSQFKSVLIDEGQFFSDLPEQVTRFVEDLGKSVHVVGLSGDYKRKNFGRIHELIPLADKLEIVTTLCAICAEQGVETPAIHTQRIDDTSGKQTEIGAANYRPVCRQCYVDEEAKTKAKVSAVPIQNKKGKGRR
jgi:thymidine kinase